MGARYLISEDEAIVKYYPTATRDNILMLIPNRTWAQIGVKARKMGIHRTTKAWGHSVWEGRKAEGNAWSDEDNKKFDSLYPHATHAQLFAAFPSRNMTALRARAQRHGLHRTSEAIRTQMKIGKRNARKEKKG